MKENKTLHFIKNNFLLKLLGLLVVMYLTFTAFKDSDNEKKVIESWIVDRKNVSKSIFQKGKLSAKDKTPVIVRCSGNIMELMETGSIVKAGDIVLVMDVEEIQDHINNSEVEIQELELDVERQSQELQFLLFEKDLRLEIMEARFNHAQLVLEYETSKPLPHDLRKMEIDEELAAINLKNAELDYQAKRRLFEKGFLSESALEPYIMRKETSNTFLDETLLKNSILKKGISSEQRIELEALAKSAKSNWQRTKANFLKRIEKKELQLEATKKRLEISKLVLDRELAEKDSAVVYAETDGILVRRTYRDWSAGGVRTEFKPGEMRWNLDIVADIIDPTNMEIQVAFNEADYHLLAIGMEVKVEIPALPGKKFKGSITHLGAIGKDRNQSDPTANISGTSGVMTYPATVELSDKDSQFRPGMSADLQVLTGTQEDAIIIPRAFIVEKEGSLFVNKGSGFNHSIEGEILDNIWFVIRSGLQKGDKVFR